MKSLVLIIMMILSLSATTWAFEISGDYASVSYDSETVLDAFNNKLFMGQLRYLLRGKRAITLEDEVISKIDVISQQVQEVLDMHPSPLHYTMNLCESPEKVEKAYLSLYGVTWKRPAFYSPVKDTIYLDAVTSSVKIVAHEVGHVVVEKYFQIKPPLKVHELLAQYAEKHIGD